MTEITDKDTYWVTEIDYINETNGNEEHLALHYNRKNYAELRLSLEVNNWFGKLFSNHNLPEKLIGSEKLHIDSNGKHKPSEEITQQRIEIMQQLLNLRRLHGGDKETFSARVYEKKKDDQMEKVKVNGIIPPNDQKRSFIVHDIHGHSYLAETEPGSCCYTVYN